MSSCLSVKAKPSLLALGATNMNRPWLSPCFLKVRRRGGGEGGGIRAWPSKQMDAAVTCNLLTSSFIHNQVPAATFAIFC